MDRKECYRLTHPLSKISGYAIGFSQVSDGQFPATNHTFHIAVVPLTRSFASASSTLKLVQGDRLTVLDPACLPLSTNGPRDEAVYRMKVAPSRGQLIRRRPATRTVEEFTQQQVNRSKVPEVLEVLEVLLVPVGLWVTWSMGHLGHLSRPGHWVITLTRCETRIFPVFEKMPKMQNVRLKC